MFHDCNNKNVSLDECLSTCSQFFDEIMSVLNDLEEIYTDEDGPAIVFQCRTGKGRTTTAMAIGGLIVCHKKVFFIILKGVYINQMKTQDFSVRKRQTQGVDGVNQVILCQFFPKSPM